MRTSSTVKCPRLAIDVDLIHDEILSFAVDQLMSDSTTECLARGCIFWARDGLRFPVTLPIVNMRIDLPDELVAQIDAVAEDRSAFVAEAVRRLLHGQHGDSVEDEIESINQLADELNAEPKMFSSIRSYRETRRNVPRAASMSR
jgi:hypothetical protein